jgi:hypothetical protein
MPYSPTANVGNYYQSQGDPQDELLVTEDQMNKEAQLRVQQEDQLKQQEEQKKQAAADAAKTPEQKEKEKKDAEAKNANPAQEVGTAVVGAGIDLVEGIGATAEGLSTGQILDPNFKPTWLQVNDEVEPMNKTVWGNILRGVGEFGLGMAVTGGLGHLSKASKIPVLLQAGRYIADPKTTVLGRAVQGTVKSAVVTFSSSQAESETINDGLKEIFPWMPSITTTDDDDSPLERRIKNVVEDIGLGTITEIAFGFRAGKRVAQALDEGKLPRADIDFKKVSNEIEKTKAELAEIIDPESPEALKKMRRLEKLQQKLDDGLAKDPDAVAEAKRAEIRADQEAVGKENISYDLEMDPEISKPTPSLHPDYFDAPDKGFRTIPEANLYQHMKSLLDQASRGDFSAGRRANLVTDAAITRMARDNNELKKQLDAFSAEIQKGLEIPAGKNVGGLATDLNGVKKLAVARYTDIMQTFPDLSKGDWEDINKMLLEDSIEVTNVSGSKTKVMNSANAMALEMLMYDLNTAVADKATALHSVINKVPVEEGLNNLLNKVEGAFMMNQQASEFAGSLLRARRGDAIGQTARAFSSVDKQKQIRSFMNNLRQVVLEDPEMTEVFVRAFAESNGEVHTMEALRRYASDTVFNWKSLTGKDGAKSRFVDGMFTTLYNSILSAPKTIARAFSGTNLLTVMRPVQIAAGGLLGGDMKTTAKGMHMAFDGMLGSIDEAWQLARNTHFSLVNNQAGAYVNQIVSPSETAYWKSLGAVIDAKGSAGEKAMYNLVSTMQDFNNQSWVRYPANAMAAIDTFSKTLIGRQELKARAFEAAWNESNGHVTKDLLKKYEANLRNTIFNQQGEVIDTTAELAGKEVALQLPLTGRLATMDKVLNQTPMLRPFFLFMKTAWNALEVVQKHTPILARFNDEVAAVLRATPDNFDDVLKYGISDAAALSQAKALIRGRVATGYMTVGSAVGLYTTGRLTGNGPADKETRNAWTKNGWKPRSIKFGDKWVNYDGLEPFASFLAVVADIGDNANTLGEGGTENFLRKAGYLIGMNVTNKSFLAGLQPLTDILAFDGARGQVWAGNLANNFIPWSGARNEIANVLNPGLREVEKDLLDTIKNRNPGLRGTLALQYDPLDGSVVKDWDFPTRMWNSVSPIQVSGKDNATRRRLRESGYDMVPTFTTDSYGNRLTPKQRSKLAQLMGQQNIEAQLAELFKKPQFQKELEYYRRKRNSGVPGTQMNDPNNLPIKDSLLYRSIDRIFSKAKRIAELEMYKEDPTLRQAGVDRKVKQKLQRSGRQEDIDRLFFNNNK